MGCRKNSCRRQAWMTQFCYEHQRFECCMRKIFRNAEELGRILDSMPPKNGKEKEREKGKEKKKENEK